MTKADLIEKVAEDTNISKAEAGRLLNSVLDNMTSALKGGDTVTLVGFGTFSVSHRAARTGRNPQTGAMISIAASKVPRFKAGKALKDTING